jgi:hypothetical protein
MEGKRFIHKIKLQNFLSYGSTGEEIELQPLNVLIGHIVRQSSPYCDRLFTKIKDQIRMRGLLKTDQPAPTDEQVAAMLEERGAEKYL